MLSRLARWWLSRAERRAARRAPVWVAECETCEAPAEHRLVAASGDDEALGITDGGTLMAADFCAEHCPGGCTLGCVASAT